MGSNSDADLLFECFKRGKSPITSTKFNKKKVHSKIANTGSNKMSAQIVYSTQNNHVNGLVDSASTTKQEANISKSESFLTPPNQKKKGSGKEISPGIFYGSPAGKPSRKSPHLWKLLHNIQKDLTNEKDQKIRAIWVTFPRQDQAMQFAENHTNVYVFCYQDHITSLRRFLATTHEELWMRYKRMDARYRHHYEVIQEGHPCHLYFDLEFNRLLNAEANGSTMVDLLLSVVCDAFLDIYGIHLEHDWIVELDSSTPEKFSRHLIVHVPNVAFKDNLHVGAFVGEVCAKIAKLHEVDKKYQQLYMLKGDCHSELRSDLFLDSAVYSRNRCFRLPFSTKAGKHSFLLPTDRFKCKNMTDYEVFMHSLICRKDPCTERLLTFDTKATHNEIIINSYYVSGAPRTLQSRATSSSIFGQSPFPQLDAFVVSISSVGNIPGYIRSWYWFAEYGVMVYNISGNRFCENIGRQHKSNHVMYIVDFRTAGYYQKCHDPDCRGFRSPLRPIPPETIPEEFRTECLQQLVQAQVADNGQYFEMSKSDSYSACSSTVSNNETSNQDWELDIWNDDSAWEEILTTVEKAGIGMDASQPTTQPRDNQEDMAPSDDDDWWVAADFEITQLEKRIGKSSVSST